MGCSDVQKLGSGDAMGSRRRIYSTIKGLMQSWVCSDWGSWMGIPTLWRQLQCTFFFRYVLHLHFFVWFPCLQNLSTYNCIFYIAHLLLSHEVRKLSKINFQNQKYLFMKSANKGLIASHSIMFSICSNEYGYFHEMNTFQNLFLEEGSTCMWFGNKMLEMVPSSEGMVRPALWYLYKAQIWFVFLDVNVFVSQMLKDKGLLVCFLFIACFRSGILYIYLYLCKMLYSTE